MQRHILFVDDEAPIREMLSLYFRKKGFAVTTAMTAQHGKELADKTAFDLAVLDVDLAGENGLELLALLKQKHPDLPVVMFTGMGSSEELLQQAMSRGANGFMRKSESLDTLFAEVSRHLKPQ